MKMDEMNKKKLKSEIRTVRITTLVTAILMASAFSLIKYPILAGISGGLGTLLLIFVICRSVEIAVLGGSYRSE
jgi:phosphotransferase system  glucose/maltose/N-acetylglucosamine-specific IIC component